MIQFGVTRAVRAWAGEASSRLAAKSRAQKLRRLSRAPIEAIEAIEIVAGSTSGAIGAIGVESPASRPGEDAGGEKRTRKWRLGTSCTNTRTGELDVDTLSRTLAIHYPDYVSASSTTELVEETHENKESCGDDVE